MNLTEDDTYKMLKGLTEEEAMTKFTEVYSRVATELAIPVGGVPMSLIKAKIDSELMPYGWSFDKLFSGIVIS